MIVFYLLEIYYVRNIEYSNLATMQRQNDLELI